MIPEELLHFIWQFRLFNQLGLCSTDGEHVKIQFVGEYNSNAGPDFLHARVAIADQLWHGNIELHIDGKDWVSHKHHLNEAYNSVILHVVWRNGVGVWRADGTRMPCLVLSEYLDETLLTRYQQLMDNRHWISCEGHLVRQNMVTIEMTKGRMLAERMEKQYLRIKDLHEKTMADWERILFLLLSRSFGMKVNADVFMRLGELIDLNLLRKYVDDPIKQEALFFGQAGLLSERLVDEYGRGLSKEYNYLREIHVLGEVNSVAWKYLRMRPVNFPCFRIGQLVGLYGANPYFFDNLLTCSSVVELIRLCDNIRTASYWQTHYQFDRATRFHPTKISKGFADHLLINAFVPTLFAYGKMTGQPVYVQRALDWLGEIKAEDNHIIRRFNQHGIVASNAADSQALLQLKTAYCDKKKCLACSIGLSILRC